MLATSDQRRLRASALNALGVLQMREDARTEPETSPPADPPLLRSEDDIDRRSYVTASYGCDPGQLARDGRSWRVLASSSGRATALLRDAHALSPDDAVVTCNLAAARLTRGDTRSNQLRADLAEALVCERKRERSCSETLHPLPCDDAQRAQTLLVDLVEREASRELQPYADAPDLAPLEKLEAYCTLPIAQASDRSCAPGADCRVTSSLACTPPLGL